MPLNEIDGILNMITEESNTRQAELIKNAESLLKSETDHALSRVNAEIAERIRVKTAEINAEAGKRISASQSQWRANLFKRREEIRKSVFDEAFKEIEEFTQTEKYKDLLIASADKIYAKTRGRCAVLHIREKDRPYAAEICGHLGKSITVHVEKSIILGGIIVSSDDGSMMINDTLDNRLEELEQWFMENSGLVID